MHPLHATASIVLVWMTLVSLPASAQPNATGSAPIALQVESPRSPVAVGEAFELHVVLSLRTEAQVDKLMLPEMPNGLTVLQERRGTSTRISAVNGQRQILMEERFTSIVRADAPGSFVISGVSARAGGVTATAAPVTIRVVGDNSSDAGRADAATGGATQDSGVQVPGARFGKKPPNAFLEVSLDKSEAWVGEQVTVTTEVYTQQPLAQWPRLAALKPTGFFCTSLLDETRPNPTQRTVAGRPYYVYLVNKDALVPLSAGEKTIPAQDLELSPAGSLFSRTREVSVRSAAVRLDIKPLPETGKPAGFSVGNVGLWELSSSVHPSDVALGEPVTLTLTATGTGSIEQLELPTWDGGGQARVFPATVRREPLTPSLLAPELGGRVVVELLVQPHAVGLLHIPSFVLATFDPASSAYRESRTTPLTVRVTTPRQVAPASAQTSASTAQVIARGVRPLKRNIEASAPPSESLVLLASSMCTLGISGWGFATARRRRLSSPTGQRNERRRAREKLLADAVSRGDLAMLESIVLDALADRCGDVVKSYPTRALADALEPHGVSRADADALVRFIHDVEAARYARTTLTSADYEDLGRVARAALVSLDVSTEAV